MYGIYSKLATKAPGRLVEYPLSKTNLFKADWKGLFQL